MSEATCAVCRAPFTPKTKRSRCCSEKCAKKYYRERPGTECSVEGCTRPVRAKGLCSTDYNKIHCPDRHRFELQCACCGEPHVSKRNGGKYCSHLCYVYATYGPAKSDIHVGDCIRCGEAFALRFSQRGYCSEACREAAACDRAAVALDRATAVRAADREQRLANLRVGECPACGSEFRTNQPHKLTCTDKCAARMQRIRRRVSEAGSYGEYRWSDFMRIVAKFDGRCAYCDKRPADGDQLEPDHVVPISKGGPNTISNLLPSCHQCNSGKCDRSLEEWAAFRAARNKPPRRTTWSADDDRFHHLTSVRGESTQTDAA